LAAFTVAVEAMGLEDWPDILLERRRRCGLRGQGEQERAEGEEAHDGAGQGF
jgi:hypothetical protein